MLLPLFLNAQAPPLVGSTLGNKAPSPPKRGPVVVHQIQYTGTLSETKASFVAVADDGLELELLSGTPRPQAKGDNVTSSAILILNEKHGAIIRESKPPKQ